MRSTRQKETELRKHIIPECVENSQIIAQDFCLQVVRQSRGNAIAFQGFAVPLGGKKTSKKWLFSVHFGIIKGDANGR